MREDGWARETDSAGQRGTGYQGYISSPVEHMYEDTERKQSEEARTVVSLVDAQKRRESEMVVLEQA